MVVVSVPVVRVAVPVPMMPVVPMPVTMPVMAMSVPVLSVVAACVGRHPYSCAEDTGASIAMNGSV